MRIEVRGNPIHIDKDTGGVLARGLKIRAETMLKNRSHVESVFIHDDSLTSVEGAKVIVTDIEREDVHPQEFAEYLAIYLSEGFKDMIDVEVPALALRIDVTFGKREGAWIRLG